MLYVACSGLFLLAMLKETSRSYLVFTLFLTTPYLVSFEV